MINFEQKKKDARSHLEQYSNEIRDYRKTDGNKYTDYLVFRLQMEEY